jgi:hypothetical protein
MLEEIAADLEDEAKRVDSEERFKPSKRPPAQDNRQD